MSIHAYIHASKVALLYQRSPVPLYPTASLPRLFETTKREETAAAAFAVPLPLPSEPPPAAENEGGGERGSGGGGVVKRERSPPSPPFSRNGLTAVGVATGDGRRDTLQSKNVWEDVMLSSLFDFEPTWKGSEGFHRLFLKFMYASSFPSSLSTSSHAASASETLQSWTERAPPPPLYMVAPEPRRLRVVVFPGLKFGDGSDQPDAQNLM